MGSKWVFLFGFGPRFRFLKSLVFTDLVSDYFEGVQIDSMFGFGLFFDLSFSHCCGTLAVLSWRCIVSLLFT